MAEIISKENSNWELTRQFDVNKITREEWILKVFPEWGTWLNEEIERTAVKPDTFAMWWLGNMGIWMKTPGGGNLTIDMWVSRGKYSHDVPTQGPDYQMNRQTGGRSIQPNLRGIPCVIDPFAIKDLDVFMATHFHFDHMDAYATAAVLQNCPDCIFVGPQFCADFWTRWGVPAERIKIVRPGDTLKIKDMEITALEAADRTALITAPPAGDMTGKLLDMDERAVNYLVKTPGGSFYHAGDSHMTNLFRKHGVKYKIDVACGAFGENPKGVRDKLSPYDILSMAENLECKVVIPLHYDLWVNMRGDPTNIDILYEFNKYRMQYKFKPFIWEVGGRFVYPDDKDKRRYMYDRGFDDAYTYDANLPFPSFL